MCRATIPNFTSPGLLDNNSQHQCVVVGENSVRKTGNRTAAEQLDSEAESCHLHYLLFKALKL